MTDKSIAYCGLACCVCSENNKCPGCQAGGCDIHGWCKNYNCCREKGLNGCWECGDFESKAAEPACKGSMLDKPRIRAFAKFAKEYGTDELIRCLLRNKANGIIYHYDGQLVGDYDKCKTEEEIIEMIKNGSKTMNYRFIKASMPDILTFAEWYKSESVSKWIGIDDWISYYEAVKDLPDYYLYSVFAGNELISYIAGEITDEYLAMAIIVDPTKHGQGIGTSVLLDMFAHTTELFGNIKGYRSYIYSDNFASKRCFEKAGFQYEKDGDDGEMVYKREYNAVDTTTHYDALIDENNDPVHDPAPLKEYMNKWDGQVFINELQLSKDKNVLEIGVGTGRLAILIAPLCGKFTGIDISPKTIERAKENLSVFQNINLICGDFITAAFDEQYDVVYSSLTFMHIEDKLTAINKAARLLKSGGRFVLSIDKNRDEYIDLGNRKVRIYPDNPNDIKGFIKAAGLLPEKQFETEFAHIFAARKA